MDDVFDPENIDFDEPLAGDVFLENLDHAAPGATYHSTDPLGTWAFARSSDTPDPQSSTPSPWEMMDLGGLYETLPPMEMIEEL